MNFIKQFLLHPTEVGSLIPSSKTLSKSIVNIPNLKTKNCVVELGTGNGVVTQEIIKNLHSKTIFFGIEINEKFVEETKKNCPDTNIYHGSAINLKKYLKKNNFEYSDCIISELPWGAFNNHLQDELLEAIYNSLDKNGDFITISFAQSMIFSPSKRFSQLIKKKFDKVEKTPIIWKNFPPAFIYHCIK